MNIINELCLYGASTLIFLPLTVAPRARTKSAVCSQGDALHLVLGRTPKVPGLNDTQAMFDDQGHLLTPRSK